ncbi:MAG: MAPEG family protein [Litoreibacter sp.]|uniref:MAPEG family protein n=1 Tax=Litoreibacter sp. TaxID=1969459 RepID=UPI003296C97D
MPLIEIIALLAVTQFMYFGYKVGIQRRDSGLKAPAMTGHEGFERAYRVQMNTLEVLVPFLPVLLLSGQYWPALLIAPIGIVYLVGRGLYAQAYVSNPSKRGLGFMLSLGAVAALLLLALLGAVFG